MLSDLCTIISLLTKIGSTVLVCTTLDLPSSQLIALRLAHFPFLTRMEDAFAVLHATNSERQCKDLFQAQMPLFKMLPVYSMTILISTIALLC